MAKKKMKKNEAVKRDKMTGEAGTGPLLPQNILSMGERVEEDKNIYISQKIYKEIHKFTQNKITNESGGMLIGDIIEEFGKTNVLINGFIEAKHCEATPTTLKFTHETWEYVHKETEKKFPGKKIVGWIHTHPDFGIFLSEYDKFIQENFFKEEYQIAYVIDPIQKIEGFYFWINRKIERCRGFYIFDKTGTKISINAEKEEEGGREEREVFSWKNAVLAILCAAVAGLIFLNMTAESKIKRLQSQQETLAESANQSFAYMQQQIEALTSEVFSLKQMLEPANKDVKDESGGAPEDKKEETEGGKEGSEDKKEGADNIDGEENQNE